MPSNSLTQGTSCAKSSKVLSDSRNLRPRHDIIWTKEARHTYIAGRRSIGLNVYVNVCSECLLESRLRYREIRKCLETYDGKNGHCVAARPIGIQKNLLIVWLRIDGIQAYHGRDLSPITTISTGKHVFHFCCPHAVHAALLRSF